MKNWSKTGKYIKKKKKKKKENQHPKNKFLNLKKIKTTKKLRILP